MEETDGGFKEKMQKLEINYYIEKTWQKLEISWKWRNVWK